VAEFAKKQAPLLKKNIAWAAQTQVAHWMNVIAGWKQMLGADWDKTYAASNTIYVARQNNILFSVLAQFFGPEAINDRLMLIETISFTTTPDEMLEALTRIISDRWVGAAFFGNYYTMDFELMGGDARQAIIDEDAKLKITPTLPPQVPFGSHQWPTLITPGPQVSAAAAALAPCATRGNDSFGSHNAMSASARAVQGRGVQTDTHMLKLIGRYRALLPLFRLVGVPLHRHLVESGKPNASPQ